MRKDILVPFDGSKNALEALQTAIELAKAFNEKIILLNVQLKFETLHTKMFFSSDAIREYQEQLAQEAMESAMPILKESGVQYETKLRIGNPKEQICQEANGSLQQEGACPQSAVRWIVMGSRGMNAVVGGMLGSVSYGVLHEAKCPVMIIPYSC